MAPDKPLPYNDEFSSTEEYIAELLEFSASSELFQALCGGVHIVDYFTIGAGPFYDVLPTSWHPYLFACDIMSFVRLLATGRPDDSRSEDEIQPPQSLIDYVHSIHRLSMTRKPSSCKVTGRETLPRTISIGMKQKKIHEVVNFAEYVKRLSGDIQEGGGDAISHYVDFGSGQNYLGRALAAEPYNLRVVAVEGRDHNVAAAKGKDVNSGLIKKPKVMRNKKIWEQIKKIRKHEDTEDPESIRKAIEAIEGSEAYDFRPRNVLGLKWDGVEKGKGHVQYVSGRLDSGDLTDVIANIERHPPSQEDSAVAGAQAERERALKLMAISIHSCGNLSHYGIRSLIMNDDVRAIAIVGCCYNLLTEKLGPPTYKQPLLRPTLQALNGRLRRESDKFDPQGFPMSERLSTYGAGGQGVRLNITARMMACQALPNWSELDSESFFQRHFFRALLQKIFLDRGVVRKIRHDGGDPETVEEPQNGEVSSSSTTFNISTNPVAIGTLGKHCYKSFVAYVRGAVKKLSTTEDFKLYANVMEEKMSDITDEEILSYEKAYMPRKKELSALWSMMAFSAMAVESIIVTDRWCFLKENSDVVKDAWVEPVFDYKQSPRNLVVVGIKR
jgi:hypothetical protein